SYDILKKYFPYVVSKSRSNRILMKKFLEEDISIISSQKIMMEYLIEQSSLERALKKVKKKEYKNETFPKLSDCMTETIEEKFLNMGETSKNIYKIIQKAITWRKEFEVVQIGEKFQINNQTFDSEKEAEMFAFLEFCENSSCYLK
ncbi:MAG: hypothetical protein K9L74_05615, partial [Candidatus Izimaplasma sp.]|nr:hypothetical protein [Candidatus Izimaplasma bacterium]